jgi:hypothetical protein
MAMVVVLGRNLKGSGGGGRISALITQAIDFNVEGSRNLAFYLADTQIGLMLDLDTIVPVETINEALT